MRGDAGGGYAVPGAVPEDNILTTGDPFFAYVDFPNTALQTTRRVLCCCVTTEMKIERKKQVYIEYGQLPKTKLKGQLLMTEKKNDTFHFGVVANYKEMKFDGSHIHIANLTIEDGNWTIEDQALKSIEDTLGTIHTIVPPKLVGVNVSKDLPQTKVNTGKVTETKTWKCPFCLCVLTHKQARPIATRYHIGCHARVGDVIRGEKPLENMTHCGICGSVSLGCECRRQIGKHADRPLFKCRKVTVGNWSKTYVTKGKKPGPRLVTCGACKEWEWNFNMKSHYMKTHNTIPMKKEDQEAYAELTEKIAKKHLADVKKTESRLPRAKGTAKKKAKPKKKKVKSKFREKRESKKKKSGPAKRSKKRKSPPDIKNTIKQEPLFKKQRKNNGKKPSLDESLAELLGVKRKPIPKTEPNTGPPQKRQRGLQRKKRSFDDSSDEEGTFFTTRRRKRVNRSQSPMKPSTGEKVMAEWDTLLGSVNDTILGPDSE